MLIICGLALSGQSAFSRAVPAGAHLGIFISMQRCCLTGLKVRELLMFACSLALVFAATHAHRLYVLLAQQQYSGRIHI